MQMCSSFCSKIFILTAKKNQNKQSYSNKYSDWRGTFLHFNGRPDENKHREEILEFFLNKERK